MADAEKLKRYGEKIKIFHGLQPDEVEYVLHCGKQLHFRPNTNIFHEGMLGTNLFIVLSGKVGIYNKAELIAECGVGDCFGEMAVLNNRPRNATATALSECRVFTLDERSINEILEKRVAVRLLLNIIHVLSDWLERATAENTRLLKLVKSMDKAP